MIGEIALILTLNAPPQCGPRETLLRAIQGEKFLEGRIGVGISETGDSLFEFFTNKKTGTWTLLRSKPLPDGKTWSCIVESGRGWNELHDPAGEDL